MLVDATGAPLRAAPTPAPEATLGEGADGMPPEPSEQELQAAEKFAHDVVVTRSALRATMQQIEAAANNGIKTLQMPVMELHAMVALCVSTVDAILEVERPGDAPDLGDSMAELQQMTFAMLCMTTADAVEQRRKARLGITVVGEGALGVLPPNAQETLQSLRG